MISNQDLVFAPRLCKSYTEPIDIRSTTRKGRAALTKRRRNIRPRGLWNTGQSCHLGAAITALSAIPSLRAWLLQMQCEENSQIGLLKLYLLEAATSDKRGSLDPRPILQLLEQSGWKSRHAQDSHETIVRIIEMLDNWGGADRKTTSSCGRGFEHVPTGGSSARNCLGRLPVVPETVTREVRLPFSTVTSSSVRCHNCGYVSPRSFQNSYVVSLPISLQRQTLSKHFVQTNMTQETVEMRCETCNVLNRHTRNLNIERLPKVLIVHLQKAVFASGSVGATHGHVLFGEKLSLPLSAAGRRQYSVKTFTLRSVVRHHGGATGRNGHFDCVVSQGSSASDGLVSLWNVARWWHVSDDSVRQCQALEACDPGPAYLVAYELDE